eukprot:g41137.t1
MKVNKTLTSLALENNGIGDAGAQTIGEALRVNKMLTSLALENDGIGDAGAQAMGEALRENKECKLEKLDISRNQIGAGGAQHIAKALEPGDLNKLISHTLQINLSLRELEMDEHVKGKDEYFEMNKLYATVIQQSNFQALGLQIITEFFLAAKADSPEQVIAFVSMMPEIKTAEENKATPDIMLQNAARVGLLEACKVLTSCKDFDFDKSAARKAGEGSSDAATKEFFRVYGLDLYLGRYLRAQEPALLQLVVGYSIFIHSLICCSFCLNLGWSDESPTCSVWMAEDVKAENAQDAKVALKVIKAGVTGAQHSFEREVRSRDTLGSLPGFVLPLIRTHKKELCLVMPAGDYSLAEFLRRRDIPGRDVKKVQEIILQIIACLEKLHARQLVHGDVKPNNIISIRNNKFVLIDFDAAAEFGKPVGVKYSTSYCEPQLAAVVARRQVQGKDQLQMDESELPKAEGAFDVFSLGVILYEMCTGKQLFSHIKDNIEEAEELKQFCVWTGVPNHHLSSVFPAASIDDRDDEIQPEPVRADACHLIRWCLQPERKDRPTLEQIKSHRFLGGKTPPPFAQVWPNFNLKKILTTGTTRMSYHFFISHMQVEAAGDVGNLSAELRKLGAYVWRDMDAQDLTEEGMCQGVADSDVVILFQTNGVLSRPYCLKEILWALLLEKPLVIVSELDKRFFPFDWLRWTQDRLQKLPGWDQWAVSHNLGSTYKDCLLNYKNLHDIVKERWDSGNFIPFRRRNFEVSAMVREIFAQAGQNGCAWGERLPPEALPQPPSTWPRVFVIRGERGRAMASELCGALKHRYQGLALHTSDEPEVPAELKSAERVVVLLTGGVLAERSSSMTHLRYAVQNAKPLFALYSEEAGWEFGGRESRNAPQWVMSVVGELEAMVFRPKAQRAYESLAMCDELVRRMVGPFKLLEPLTDEQVEVSEAKERAERAANQIGQATAPVQDVAATASVEQLRAMLQAEKKTAEEMQLRLEKEYKTAEEKQLRLEKEYKTAEERLQVMLEKEREAAARLRAEIEQLRASHSSSSSSKAPEWAARAAAAGHPRAQSCLNTRGQAIVVDQQLNSLVRIATGAREPALAGALWSRDYHLWDGAPPAERARFARQLRARTGLPLLAGRELRRVHPLTATAISFLFARFGLPVAAQVVVHSPSLAVASSIDQVWRCSAGRLWLLEHKKAQSAGRAHGKQARAPPLAHVLWRTWADTEENRILVQAALGHVLGAFHNDRHQIPGLRHRLRRQPPRRVCFGTRHYLKGVQVDVRALQRMPDQYRSSPLAWLNQDQSYQHWWDA